ncbi:transmembrane protein, putative [Medicago truncatula]|uniref:Transmembrane protein, putative n=1 Tax=Medicago truncatula TaxID=3880 RepID=A0A072U4Y0_MEDTR|nr:transmembrane protein, putative [Medicago truncatula]
MPSITYFTNWTLPMIDKRQPFQDEGFIFILLTIGLRQISLGLLLEDRNTITPRYHLPTEIDLVDK